MQAFFRLARSMIPVTLAVMVLLRLVWIQIRPYRPIPTEFTTAFAHSFYLENGGNCRLDEGQLPELARNIRPAPAIIKGYQIVTATDCERGKTGMRFLLKFNQWVYISTALAAALTARLITSSWTMALGIAAMLLSRGHLLAAAEHIDLRVLLQSGCAWLFLLATHILRSGSVLIAAIGAVVLALLMSIEPLFWALGWLPLLWLSVAYLRQSVQGPTKLRSFYAKGHAANRLNWAARLTGNQKIRGASGFALWLLNHPAMIEDRIGTHPSRRKLMQKGHWYTPLQIPLRIWLQVKRSWPQAFLWSAAIFMVWTAILAICYWPLSAPYHWAAHLQIIQDTTLLNVLSSHSNLLEIDLHILFSLASILIVTFTSLSTSDSHIRNSGYLLGLFMLLLGTGEAIMQNFIGARFEAIPFGHLTMYLSQPLFLMLGVCAIHALFQRISHS